MSFASEFKEFAMKGNVIDLAVGVVIGAAFGKIVGSLVGDVIMPLLSPLLGSINFSDLALRIATDAAGKPVLLKYGDVSAGVLGVPDHRARDFHRHQGHQPPEASPPERPASGTQQDRGIAAGYTGYSG